MIRWRIFKRNKDRFYLVKNNLTVSEPAIWISYRGKWPVRIWTGLPDDVEQLGTVTAQDDVQIAWNVASKILIGDKYKDFL
jgi:hypothetical protein